jgi:excisionase family DNA binding protein
VAPPPAIWGLDCGSNPTGCVSGRSVFTSVPEWPTLPSMRANGNQSATSPTSPRPVGGITVQEAADLLGTTVDGVRSRIKRGTLDSAKVGGAVYVLLDPDQSPPSSDQPGLGGTSPDQSATSPEDRDALLAAKDETISHLRRELDARNEELRRKDTIIMTLAQRVPELEAPQDGQEDAQEPPNGAGVANQGQEPERRSWWRRVFGP